ncbi:MAG: osmotically inducible protein OsmC [Flammeovirgaceae bacterium]|nr:osmotically inducible protein OsmC [Flammeovirgaceae bacterium]
MEMEVALGFKSDEEFFTINNTHNRVEIDMYGPGKKQAQSPMELLLSGIISCAAVDIVSMIKKRRKVLNDLSGKASGQRRKLAPRSFTEIHIHYEINSPDLTDQEAEKIISLAVDKYCSVASSISKDIHLSHGFEIKR